MWNNWDTVDEAVGDIVLVEFKVHGVRRIEDAVICKDDDGSFYYILFDGGMYNVNVEPKRRMRMEPNRWMRIPE